MTVGDLEKALKEVKDKTKPVVVLDKQGDFEMEIACAEEDTERVLVIVEEWPKL